MNKEQLFGIVRTVAAAGFGYLAGKGLIDGATVDALAAAKESGKLKLSSIGLTEEEIKAFGF